MKTNNLYRLTRGEEQRYFTNLYRAAEYVGSQRAQVEYNFLKKRPIKGWDITIIDGKDIPWGSIDCDNVK